MLTRCPTCQTVFRVSQEQLDARHGIVRCGHCLKPFAALQNKLDERVENRAATPPAPQQQPVRPPAPTIAAEPVPPRVEVNQTATTIKIPPYAEETPSIRTQENAPQRVQLERAAQERVVQEQVPPNVVAPTSTSAPFSTASKPPKTHPQTTQQQEPPSQPAPTVSPRLLSGLDFSTFGKIPLRKEPRIETYGQLQREPQQKSPAPGGIGAWQQSLQDVRSGNKGAQRPATQAESEQERVNRLASITQSRPPGRIEPADNAVWREVRPDESKSIYSSTIRESLEARKVVAPNLDLVPMDPTETLILNKKRFEPTMSRAPGGVLSRPVGHREDEDEDSSLSIAPLTRGSYTLSARIHGESTTASVMPSTGFSTGVSLSQSSLLDDEDEAQIHTRRLDQTYGQRASTGDGLRKAIYGVFIFVLSVAALLQAAFLFRAELAREVPGLRHVIVSLCDAMKCEVPMPREIALIEIVDSDLQAQLGESGRFVLHATLINRAGYVQEWPSLELTLTDAIDNPVSRKVLRPKDWAPPERLPSGFPSRSEAVVRLAFHTDLTPTGYRLYAFYP